MAAPPPGAAGQAALDRLLRAEAPAAHALARGERPPVWERAEGALVFDVDGNRYLDLVGGFGVAAIGHQHPRVVEAVRAQAGRLAHGFGDVHPHAQRVELAERLTALAPFPDAKVVFAQSGAEAVELALKTAQLVTGKPGVLAFLGGFHGQSWGALTVSGWERFRAPFEGDGPAALHPRARFAPYGRCSRCDLGLSYPSCGLACLRDAGRILEAGAKRLGGIGAVLVEPVLGRGGDHVPPPEWLPGIAGLAEVHDALLVADEIYTGLGRTGALWASVEAGVTPDLLCLGKALGGGYPIAAVLMRGAFAAAWDAAHPISGETPHSSTFYAHPIACAAALATLDVLEEESLVVRAQELGTTLAEGLAELARSHPDAVREVRGRGLLAGLVLATPALVHHVARHALARGVIVLPSGMEGDVLSFSPPFTLDPRQLAWALAVLDEILSQIVAGQAR
ncbi:MAG: aspartate aminotransferase family protein [Candidatus Eiseniibacteriota bacterium]